VVCRDPEHRERIRGRLAASGADLERVRLVIAPTNDTWTRDCGPITVEDGARALLLGFRFDGWGGKFAAALDSALTGRLVAAGVFGQVALQRVDHVLEGGSIDSDGQGSVLTTHRCLTSRRWPDPDPQAIAERLGALLGARRILWLHRGGLEGDDTDGHIDTLARFCDPHTIAHVACDDPADSHHAELLAMRAELEALRTADGRPYRLVPLPWPRPVHDAQGRRLPATYANFLVINGAVLVPAYGDPADPLAARRLGECFPGREVVSIPCLPLLHQYGSLHCATMQIPATVSVP
jgi:agmatine/peptidylarginine deiminase